MVLISIEINDFSNFLPPDSYSLKALTYYPLVDIYLCTHTYTHTHMHVHSEIYINSTFWVIFLLKFQGWQLWIRQPVTWFISGRIWLSFYQKSTVSCSLLSRDKTSQKFPPPMLSCPVKCYYSGVVYATISRRDCFLVDFLVPWFSEYFLPLFYDDFWAIDVSTVM